MKNLINSKTRFILFAVMLAGLFSSCSKLNKVKEITEKLSNEDRLYFCEKYVSSEVGESSKFKPGKVTVMVKLKKAIGVSSVDINVTNVETGKVANTFPFTVQPSWDYIHFDDVDFDETGKYKVSCLKKDGTVIVSGEVEII
jgi:hypothetical protein